MKLTTHLHLVPRSIMVELYIHSPIRLSWRGAKLINPRENLTFTSSLELELLIIIFFIFILKDPKIR
jgi:hypothetical protein